VVVVGDVVSGVEPAVPAGVPATTVVTGIGPPAWEVEPSVEAGPMELAGDVDLAGECVVVGAGVPLVADGAADVLGVPAIDADDPPA
jgi:hypothetical protein